MTNSHANFVFGQKEQICHARRYPYFATDWAKFFGRPRLAIFPILIGTPNPTSLPLEPRRPRDCQLHSPLFPHWVTADKEWHLRVSRWNTVRFEFAKDQWHLKAYCQGRGKKTGGSNSTWLQVTMRQICSVLTNDFRTGRETCSDGVNSNHPPVQNYSITPTGVERKVSNFY